jgi:hypothetical protein
MVSRTSQDGKAEDIKYFASGKYTLIMTTNDTHTASDFVTTENLKFAALIRNLDGVEATCIILNNVITLTQAAQTNVEYTFYVFGVRA